VNPLGSPAPACGRLPGGNSEAANQLGVQHDGNRIRTTAQLIDPKDGAHVWAERYDRAIDGIFAIQDEITLSSGRRNAGQANTRDCATRRPTVSRPGRIGCRGFPLPPAHQSESEVRAVLSGKGAGA
jgi:hypothetical protein